VAGIGVVVNPHAGKNRRPHGRLERFADTVGADGVVRCPGTLAEMAAVAAELRQRRVDILAVCGGDGSFFRALTAVVRAYDGDALPRFLALQAGSMNTIARSAGCRRGRPERTLARVVADYRAGRPPATAERDLLQVGGGHFGFMVGAGAIVGFLRAYYGGGGRGPLAAARTLAHVVASAARGSALARGVLEPVEADIDCDGERVPHRRFNVIYASSITDIGLGFKATYLATRRRGCFHLLAGRVGARQVVRRLPRLRRGRPLEISSLYDSLARRVRVEFPRPTDYMIDGDVLGPVTRLEVVNGPRLSIIR
jgi:diacylglycerol kinase family enzyme